MYAQGTFNHRDLVFFSKSYKVVHLYTDCKISSPLIYNKSAYIYI